MRGSSECFKSTIFRHLDKPIYVQKYSCPLNMKFTKLKSTKLKVYCNDIRFFKSLDVIKSSMWFMYTEKWNCSYKVQFSA